MGTTVIRVGDDSDLPVKGRVVRWLDDERCVVQWSDRAGVTVENMDELSPR